MQQRKPFQSVFLIGFILMLVAVLAACGGQSQGSQSETPATAEPFANDAPLDAAYTNIMVAPFDGSDEVKESYPEALDESHSALMAALIKQGRFQQVGKALTGSPDGWLIVETEVPEMRIVSGAARFWGGAFAGSSNMIMNVKLVDAKTQTVVREKRLESGNNAFAAAWTYGSSDRSLPTDMGNIAASYLAKVVPTN
jgi:curli biogenesis system outer membrane secretion channel CsgG